jgi:hypothetical protein
MTVQGSGPSLALRFTKKEGIPIQVVPEGTPGASVVAVKRVNELDFYNLGAADLSKKLGLSISRTVAVVDYLKLREDLDCYREIKIGKSVFKRYSARALEKVQSRLKKTSVEAIWEARKKSA